ncbi:MAG TPA: hypothetical protein VMV52_10815 [Candidatus Nanopelagicaceae bacterium]|nr:hypothetical protein [Candidatus Nanopelagicaceae bacterium]
MSENSVGENSDPLNEIFSGAADERDLAEMVARDGQPLITRFTIVLGAALLFLGGIIAGSYFQSSSGAATGGANLASAFASARSGASGQSTRGASGFGGGGFGGAGGFGLPVAAGQIKLIDGKNIYVTTSTGSIVKVSTDSTTRIRQTATLTVGDLKVGDTVSVSGQAGADGTVAATSINTGEIPAGFGGGAPTAGTPSPSAASSSKPSRKSTSKKPSASGSASASPSGTAAPGGGFGNSGRGTALIDCLTKAGIKVDPTQGIRSLFGSTDPKVQAALTTCRAAAPLP